MAGVGLEHKTKEARLNVTRGYMGNERGDPASLCEKESLPWGSITPLFTTAL